MTNELKVLNIRKRIEDRKFSERTAEKFEVVDSRLVCWPSIDLIAAQWGISPRNVIRSLKWLSDRSVIQIHKQKGKSNVYEVLSKKRWRKYLMTAVRPASWQEMQDKEVSNG